MKTNVLVYDNDTLIDSSVLGPNGAVGAPKEAWDSIITAGSYLPRIQLFGGNSDAVKEMKISIGHFGLVKNKDTIESLTTEVNCIPINFRFKALRLKDGQVISIFNHLNPEFKKIQDESGTEDSGCMYGVEFLLWLPNQGEGMFVTFYLSSKSSRREAPNLRALLLKAATLKSTLVSKGKFKWHSPVVTACSTPFANLPDSEEVRKQSEKFVNEKDSAIESVSAKEAAATSREM